MEPIPDEWIEKLFNCMQDFYGERWTRIFTNDYVKKLYKTIWKNGLLGLNYNQIKGALYYYRREAKKPTALPPLVMQFYLCASSFQLSTQSALG